MNASARLFTTSFGLLVGAHFLASLGFASMLLLPLYLDWLGANRAEIGALMAGASIGGLLTRPFVAVALDAVGVALVQEELSRAEVPDPDARYELLTSTDPWAMPQLVHAMDLGLDLAREHAEVRLTMEDVELGAEIEARFRA